METSIWLHIGGKEITHINIAFAPLRDRMVAEFSAELHTASVDDTDKHQDG